MVHVRRGSNNEKNCMCPDAADADEDDDEDEYKDVGDAATISQEKDRFAASVQLQWEARKTVHVQPTVSMSWHAGWRVPPRSPVGVGASEGLRRRPDLVTPASTAEHPPPGTDE